MDHTTAASVVHGDADTFQKKRQSKQRIDNLSFWEELPLPANTLPPLATATGELPTWASFGTTAEQKDRSAAPSQNDDSKAEDDLSHAQWVAAVKAGLEPLPADAPPAPAWLEALTQKLEDVDGTAVLPVDATLDSTFQGFPARPLPTEARLGDSQRSRNVTKDGGTYLARLEERLARLTARPGRDAQMRAVDFEGLAKVVGDSLESNRSDGDDCEDRECSKLLGDWSSDEEDEVEDERFATGTRGVNGGVNKGMEDINVLLGDSSSDEDVGDATLEAGRDGEDREANHAELSEDSSSSDGNNELLGDEVQQDLVNCDVEVENEADSDEKSLSHQRETLTNLKFEYEVQIAELKHECRSKDEVNKRQSEVIEVMKAEKVELERTIEILKKKIEEDACESYWTARMSSKSVSEAIDEARRLTNLESASQL